VDEVGRCVVVLSIDEVGRGTEQLARLAGEYVIRRGCRSLREGRRVIGGSAVDAELDDEAGGGLLGLKDLLLGETGVGRGGQTIAAL